MRTGFCPQELAEAGEETATSWWFCGDREALSPCSNTVSGEGPAGTEPLGKAAGAQGVLLEGSDQLLLPDHATLLTPNHAGFPDFRYFHVPKTTGVMCFPLP